MSEMDSEPNLKRKSTENIDQSDTKKINIDDDLKGLTTNDFIDQPEDETFIPVSNEQHFERDKLMHKRLFNTSRIYLNNSNTKWIDIGVKPAANHVGNITGFTTEVFLDGDKCSRLALGNLVGFKQLVRQIRELDDFKHLQTDTYLLAYKGNELIDGFQFTRNVNFNCVCYRISKSCGADVDEITAFLNGYTVSKGTSTPTIATGTLAFLLKHEQWLVRIIEGKRPDEIFANYMTALKKFIEDPHYNLTQLAIGENFEFFQELATQFIDLLIYDVRLCLPTIEIE